MYIYIIFCAQATQFIYILKHQNSNISFSYNPFDNTQTLFVCRAENTTGFHIPGIIRQPSFSAAKPLFPVSFLNQPSFQELLSRAEE